MTTTKTTYRTLPNGDVLVHIPLRLVHKPTGARLVSDEPGENQKRNEELFNLQTVALGMKYRNMATTNQFNTRVEMAQYLGLDPSYLGRLITIGYLSPAIIEKMARGELAHITIQKLREVNSPIWAEQHAALGID